MNGTTVNQSNFIKGGVAFRTVVPTSFHYCAPPLCINTIEAGDNLNAGGDTSLMRTPRHFKGEGK